MSAAGLSQALGQDHKSFEGVGCCWSWKHTVSGKKSCDANLPDGIRVKNSDDSGQGIE
jgi:hypothetical protein